MRLIKAVLLGSSLALLAAPAMAQDDRPERPQRAAQLTPEQREAAWKLQVKGFAHQAGVSDENAEKLGKAYLKARKETNKSLREALGRGGRGGDGGDDDGGRGGRGGGEGGGRGGGGGGGAGGGGGGGDFGGMRQIMAEHREEFEEAIADLLDDDQHNRAMITLGTFNLSWDGMVNKVIGFTLADDATMTALEAIENYVAEVTELRESGDRQNMRQGMQDARSTLLDAMGAILTEEQTKEFQSSVNAGFGGRRGGPGGRGGRGSDGGQGGGRGGDGI